MTDDSSERGDKHNSTGSAARMRLGRLEKSLDSVFGSRFPLQLPAEVRDMLVKVAPWLALIGGGLGVIASWGFWRTGHEVNQLAKFANDLSVSSGGDPVTVQLGLTWYISFIVLLAQSLLMLAAYSGLKHRTKSGWDLLFYSSLLSVVLAVAYLFTSGYGFLSFVGTLLGTTIGLFLLFQIRTRYLR